MMSACKLLIFDLDGLLVNTEMMHWQAYQKACQKCGISLGWDFDSYFQVASTSSHGIQERLSREHPELFSSLPWDQFYEMKHSALLDLLSHEPIPLMPGVEKVLQRAYEKNLRMACVTHSRNSFVTSIRSQHSCFDLISSWYSRESYERPKPAPDGYLKAVEMEGVLPEEAIGFEDSLRGLQALLDAEVRPVLVTKVQEAQKAVENNPKVLVVPQIDEVLTHGPYAHFFQ